MNSRSVSCRQVTGSRRHRLTPLRVAFLSSFLVNCLFSYHLWRGRPTSTVGLSQQPSIQASTNEGAIFRVDEKLRHLAATYVDGVEYIHPRANVTPGQKAYGAKPNSVRQMAQVSSLLLDIDSPCGGRQGANLTLLTLLYCRPGDFERRQVIRQTFGSAIRRHPRAELYFLLAEDATDAKTQSKIALESQLYNDVIQVNFTDAYFNLTLKSLSALRWTALNCPSVRYLLKMDNECFLRVNPLLADLEALPNDPKNRTILGKYHARANVLRSRSSKWYIDPLYYPYDKYPPYSSGLYLIPGSLTRALYEAVVSEPTVDTIPSLPIEDVYVGVLAAKVGVTFATYPGYYQMWRRADTNNTVQLRSHSIFCEKVDNTDFQRYWTLFGEN